MGRQRCKERTYAQERTAKLNGHRSSATLRKGVSLRPSEQRKPTHPPHLTLLRPHAPEASSSPPSPAFPSSKSRPRNA